MSQHRILLIDDEPLVRDELGGLLEDEGYAVITAEDGSVGLELFRSEQPDMVISDVRMPQTDGLTVAMTIRREAPAVPVTVITGHGSYNLAIEALRAGVTDFIRKPVRIEDLTAALVRMEAALQIARFQPVDLPTAVELVERSWVYRLDNDIDAVPTFVDILLESASAGAAPENLTELSLALRELIINAIEHGNLALSYQEKTVSLEEGTLPALLETRRQMDEYKARRIKVVTRRLEDRLIIEVHDQGKGFDWRSLPDPTDPAYLLAEHGRGVLLARMSVDELSYNEEGNVVTVIKQV